MHKDVRRSFAAVAILAAALAFGTSARADLVIDYSLNNGATFNTLATTSSGGTNAISTTIGNFAINTISDTSNSPGTPSISKLLSATLSITNDATSPQNIIFAFSDTGFSAPTAPPDLVMNSHIGGSVTVNGAGNLASFTSCVSTTNTNLTNCAGANAIAGPGQPNVTAGSFSNDQFATVTSLSSPYSINQILSLTLDAGSELNFADNTTLAPVPEPASLVVFGSGLIGLGWITRRRQRSKL